MTQRKWETTDGWEVLTGWDRPLQHFFVNIDRQCTGCQGSGERPEVGEYPCATCEGSGTEYLFNNLEDTSGLTDSLGGMTLENVKHILSIKVTAVPDGLYNMLRYDQAHDMGNDVRHFGTLGEEVKETSAQ